MIAGRGRRKGLRMAFAMGASLVQLSYHSFRAQELTLAGGAFIVLSEYLAGRTALLLAGVQDDPSVQDVFTGSPRSSLQMLRESPSGWPSYPVCDGCRDRSGPDDIPIPNQRNNKGAACQAAPFPLPIQSA